MLSKVFELILLSKLNSYFCTTDYQFGFKSNHSTDLCIYTLKEVIDFYHSQSTSIYMCFMDASKAFDRVNHWTLFKKLIYRGTPLIFVRIIMQWYTCSGTPLRELVLDGGQLYRTTFSLQMVLDRVAYCHPCFLTFIWTD